MILFLINFHLWTSTFDVIFKIMITGFNNFSWNWRYWDRTVHTLWATSVLLNGLAKWHENILHWNSGAWEYRIRLQFYVEIILVVVLRPLAEFFGVSNFCLSFESFEMSFEMLFEMSLEMSFEMSFEAKKILNIRHSFSGRWSWYSWDHNRPEKDSFQKCPGYSLHQSRNYDLLKVCCPSSIF